MDVTELRPSIPIPSPVPTPMTQHFALAMCLALTIPATAARAAPPSPPERPRLVVLTDISSLTAGVAEPDDGQSLIRLMLYADEFDIEDMVAFSNMADVQRVRPELIRRVVDAYEVVSLRSWREVDDAQGDLPVVVRVRLRAPVGFLRGDGPRDEAHEPEQGGPAGRRAGAG